MSRYSLRFLFLYFAAAGAALAIDISPSKDTVPRSSWDTNSNHFSIFNGDPKRIQRANEVDPKAFDAKLVVTPSPVSLATLHAVGPNPSLKISFAIHNHGKKSYTLSFPTSQRWDFRILNSAGAVIYSYTDDHEFVQVIGSSMADPDEKLVYNDSVSLDDLGSPLSPGTYKVQAVMANYPEMAAEVELSVGP